MEDDGAVGGFLGREMWRDLLLPEGGVASGHGGGGIRGALVGGDQCLEIEHVGEVPGIGAAHGEHLVFARCAVRQILRGRGGPIIPIPPILPIGPMGGM